MEAQAEIVSKQIIKPSSPSSPHLKVFKLSFLDQLGPEAYVPAFLFYSAHEVTGSGLDFPSLNGKLKASLSDVLSLYYPFSGRVKGNVYVECNDAGVLYIEAKVPITLNDIQQYAQVNALKQFLPIDPESGCVNNEEQVLMGVQVSELSCGAVGIGVCISHKVADGIALCSFLNAWVATAKGSGGNTTKPYMEGSLLFPTIDNNFSSPLCGRVHIEKDIVATRFVFDGASLSRLKAEMGSDNFTRVEAVTALIWKSMMEATIANSSEQNLIIRSLATHIVNIRGRLVPPLPEYSIGNVCQLAVTPLVEFQVGNKVELRDLALMVRKGIIKYDKDYVSKLVGDGGFDLVVESFKQIMPSNTKGVVLWCDFTSWARFPLYEADFGWGKPTWAGSIILPVENAVLLLPTRNGEGIEAWVNITKQDMAQFRCNPKILQYASVSLASP